MIPSDQSDPKKTKERILLVEDEDELREITQIVLESAGYQVGSAPNGRAGLQLWQESKGQFDLVLTDVMMPELSGQGMAAALLKLKPDLKVVYISGYAQEAIEKHGPLVGVAAFITKPTTPKFLLETIRKLLN